MNALPIPSPKSARRERPTFRPFLETLESREVPSCADTSAAFDRLPAEMNTLQASLAARPPDVNTINSNLSTVANDMFQLKLGAPSFTVSDRLQIDNALFIDGVQLIYAGFLNYPFIPAVQFVNVEQLGAAAIQVGATDFLVTGFFPQTSGNCTLT